MILIRHSQALHMHITRMYHIYYSQALCICIAHRYCIFTLLPGTMCLNYSQALYMYTLLVCTVCIYYSQALYIYINHGYCIFTLLTGIVHKYNTSTETVHWHIFWLNPTTTYYPYFEQLSPPGLPGRFRGAGTPSWTMPRRWPSSWAATMTPL